VEWGTSCALAAARLESRHGLKATYYFHGSHRKKVFSIEARKHIESLGHEVGYHYETLDLCNGDYKAAEELFAKQLAEFREAGITIKTVCMHGNPRKKNVGYAKNSDMFKDRVEVLHEQYDLRGEAYLSVDFDVLTYISDVGIRFATMGEDCREVTRRLGNGDYRNIYILTHPDYWSRSMLRAFGLYWAGRGLRVTNLNRIVAKIRSLVRS
jgi:hypothetical protein